MNAAEDRLSELMDAATRALAPPVESILAEGERLGRRRRHRRRAAIATGTASLVLLAGVGAAAGFRYVHVDRDAAAGAAAAVHHPSRAPTPASPGSTSIPIGAATPSPAPTAPATEALEPIDPQQAVKILVMNGAIPWKFGAYDPKSTGSMSLLGFDVDDGKGLARIVVGMGSAAKSGMDPADCASQGPLLEGGGRRPAGAPPPSCAVRHYPNGDTVMQEVTKTDSYGEYQYRVIAYRSDGVALEITAANGDEKQGSAKAARTLPPLSLEQWTAIAMDRSWQPALSVPNAETAPAP